jgi:multiple sugar transport system permease protein
MTTGIKNWLGRKSNRKKIQQSISYIVATGGSIILMIPFVWMLSTSLKMESQVYAYPPEWIPSPIVWSNYIDAWNSLPFARYLFNTLFVTILGMLAEILTASLIAYGFARFRFPGRDVLFVILLATMMLPGVVLMVPTFILWRWLHLIDTFDPLTLGAWLGWGPFYIFLLRQFFLTIPVEMEEAARIEGANTLQIFYKIMLPQIKPALLVVSVFAFQGYWNDFLGPLIYINSNEKFTMTLGLNFFQGSFMGEAPKWHWMMAMTTLMAAPLLLVFFIAQRYFIEGITMTGLKG